MAGGLGTIKGQVYTCPVDAEPLQRYRPGGYHPIHIGDILKEGRYKIIQKLGFGGYSTVWAARDLAWVSLVETKLLPDRRTGRNAM